ncbi:10849_t:CDS:2, partial [Racocetra fulgida]
TVIEQYEFCRVHRKEEIIISYKIEKGYPLHIDFTILPNWIKSLKDELLKIIKGQQYSEYHVDAPGYYGTKGLAIILKTLTEMFVQSKILTTNLCIPQLLSQYLAQVLVPKTAIRLIAEDFNNIFLDMAKKIIID